MLEKQQKPKFLNLFQIAMPVTAIVSILHRLSGLLLVLFLPILIYGFYISTQSKAEFTALLNNFDSVVWRVVLIILTWITAHHIIAGIRYLLIDIDLGLSLPVAKMTAWIANIAAVVVMLVLAKGLLL